MQSTELQDPQRPNFFGTVPPFWEAGKKHVQLYDGGSWTCLRAAYALKIATKVGHYFDINKKIAQKCV